MPRVPANAAAAKRFHGWFGAIFRVIFLWQSAPAAVILSPAMNDAPQKTGEAPVADKPVADEKDAFYLDILDGLARYLDNAFIADLVETVARHPHPYLGYSLNRKQVTSKLWLLDELYRAAAGQLGTVYVLGGWNGVLSAMLLHDPRFDVERVLSVDLDPGCEAVADTMNGIHLKAGRFKAVTADMYDIDYRASRFECAGPDGAPRVVEATPDTLLNTSCEHLARFAEWYDAVPAGTLLALQSNDMFHVDVHVNCHADLAAFEAQAPMAERLYSGALKLKRTTRFMLIGRK